MIENCPTPEKHQPETMPAGVALFDYDGDGLLDIYLVNGAEMPSMVKTGPKYYNRLFHNNGDGTFTDVSERAGVTGAGYGMGVAVGDYDNDGRPDLFVANVNGNQLFHNNGDGTFTDVTAKAGLGGAMYKGRKMWSIAAGWFDYNNDGLLDLFVANYCQWDPQLRTRLHGSEWPRLLPSRQLRSASQHSVPQQWRWYVHRCFGGDRNFSSAGQGNGSRVCGLRRRRISRRVCGQRQQPEPPVSQSRRKAI